MTRSKMKTRTVRMPVFVVAALLALSAGYLAVSGLPSSAGSDSSREVTATDSPDNPGDSSRDSRLRDFEVWARDQQKVNAAEEAAPYLSFDPKIPNSQELGEIVGMYVIRVDREEGEQGINVRYDDNVDGSYFMAVPIDEELPADFYPGFVKQLISDHEKYNGGADCIPEVISVNGFPGYGCEPGLNGSGEHTEPRQGFVEWAEGKVLYKIFGTAGPDGHPLETLIRVAQSVPYEEAVNGVTW